jgi:hypothetical protein
METHDFKQKVSSFLFALSKPTNNPSFWTNWQLFMKLHFSIPLSGLDSQEIYPSTGGCARNE